eukprot:g58968.t1
MAQAEQIRTETGPLDYDYTEKEVELCQENLQNHKACSPDKIKNEMLKCQLTPAGSGIGTSRDGSNNTDPRVSPAKIARAVEQSKRQEEQAVITHLLLRVEAVGWAMHSDAALALTWECLLLRWINRANPSNLIYETKRRIRLMLGQRLDCVRTCCFT